MTFRNETGLRHDGTTRSSSFSLTDFGGGDVEGTCKQVANWFFRFLSIVLPLFLYAIDSSTFRLFSQKC